MDFSDNLDRRTRVPDLGGVLAVPPEGQDVLAGLEGLGNLHEVLPDPGSVLLEYSGKVDLGPLASADVRGPGWQFNRLVLFFRASFQAIFAAALGNYVLY